MSLPVQKICVVLPSHWAKSMGGAEYQVRFLLDALVSHGGFDIHYLARNIDPSFVPEGYRISQIKSCCPLGKYGFMFDGPSLLSELNRIRPDVIYQRVGCAYTGITAFYAKHNDCRMVWHIAAEHDVSPEAYYIGKLSPFTYAEKKCLKYGIRNATGIIAQTEHQAKLLEKNYGRKPDRIIYNFHPFPEEEIIKSRPLRVVWIANFKPIKQPHIFIDLARKLARPGVTFTMIGKAGTEYRELLKGAPWVEFLGELPQQKVNEVIAGAHLLVNTSIMEGFSNTFIQAWMRQVPVVSLNVDPDGILKEHGIGFQSMTFEQLCEDVRLLIEGDSAREKMGQAAKTYAYRKHTLDNVHQAISFLEEGV